MHDVEPRVEHELAESVSRQAGLLDQALDGGAVGLVRLELEKPEDRDGVVVCDPRELLGDETLDLRRRRQPSHLLGVEAERGEVVEQRAARARSLCISSGM